MATTSEPGELHLWTWVGLALFLAGLILWVFPLLPTTPWGGEAMRDVPRLQEWQSSGIAGLGIGVMLGARRKQQRREQ